ncbi:MAG: hypothetical protein FWG14_09875 [Peptococcaceae bacterium]|nr:hypothetical protein [Peptococcaceae bacterium]
MPKIKVAIDLLNKLKDMPSGIVTTDMIKRLRDLTHGDLSLAKCKNALDKADGNIYNAVQLLVEWGAVTLYKRTAERNIYDKIKLREPYKLSELITIIADEANEFEDSSRHSFADTGFDLYTENYEDTCYANLVCYAVDGLIVNDEDEEVYPDFVIEKNLDFYCNGWLFEDVIYQAVRQKDLQNTQPTIDELVAALDYYKKRDTYLDL